MKGVEIAVMVGGFPRKQGMERKDVMSKNVSIYQSQAAALEKHAAKGVKVIVSPIVGFRKPYLRMLGFSDGLLLERQLPWRSTPPRESR